MERPFVCINMAVTADGKITSAAREYPRFSSPHDRLAMDRLRASADAVLIGAGEGEIHEPIGSEFGMQGDVQQSALADGGDGRQSSNGSPLQCRTVQAQQAPGT